MKKNILCPNCNNKKKIDQLSEKDNNKEYHCGTCDTYFSSKDVKKEK